MNKWKETLIIVLVFAFVVIAGLMIAGYVSFIRETGEFRKRVANGEFDDYHNQPGNEFGAPVVYFRSDLERIVGVRLREKEEDIQGLKCKKYWNNREIPTDYDDLTFYIFSKEKNAQKALKLIKKNSFREITDEGDNYVRGWLDGVVDADIEEYYYVNGNLLVVTTVTAVDESARDINDPTSPVWGGGRTALEIIDMINRTF